MRLEVRGKNMNRMCVNYSKEKPGNKKQSDATRA